MIQERSLLRGQLEVVSAQLEKRIQEDLDYRNKSASRNLQLQQELLDAKNEAKICTESKEHLDKQVQEKTKRIEELLNSLRELRDNELRLEENFRVELSAQKKLGAIYENSSEEYKRKYEEYEKIVPELRTLIEEAFQQYGALERSKEQQAKEFDAECEKKEEVVAGLKEELGKVNMLLEANTKSGERVFYWFVGCPIIQ